MHECPGCGKMTDGSWSEGGLKWDICGDCMSKERIRQDGCSLKKDESVVFCEVCQELIDRDEGLRFNDGTWICIDHYGGAEPISAK